MDNFAFLSRLFTQHHSFIDGEDLIITTDVDSFPMNGDIFTKSFDPSKSRKLWIYQYGFMYRHPAASIPMSFIGMRKKLWARIIPEEKLDKQFSKAERKASQSDMCPSQQLQSQSTWTAWD